jgi:hypothetical protein
MGYNFEKQYTTGDFYIPMRMMYSLQLYIEKGVIPGHFLQKVICNDLFGAVGHADYENVRNLSAYVRFFYNQTPQSCWGSETAMKEWAEQKGLMGLKKVA